MLSNIIFSLKIFPQKGLLITIFILVSTVLPFTQHYTHPTQAQSTPWSIPVRLYETNGAIHTPIVISDPSGVLHVFWSEPSPDDPDVIMYTRWDGNFWSSPVDIISKNTARKPSAAVDNSGMIHLIWTGNHLNYSQANVYEAASARAWSEPLVLADSNITAHIISDHDGTLHIGYPGTDNQGPFYISSNDGGATWSFPTNIAYTSRDDASADFVRLAVDDSGRIHAVWSEFKLPDGWPPLGVFYANSSDGGQTWSPSMEIAGEDYDQININSLGENEIYVAWNGMVGVGGKYYKYSKNGGRDWSGTTEIIPKGIGGTSGFPQLVTDSSGELHFLSDFDSCAQYSSYSDEHWSEPECISGNEAMASGYIEETALKITTGNQLHAVFWDDRKRLWHTWKHVNAPALPTEVIPTAISQETSIPEGTTIPTPTIIKSKAEFDQASKRIFEMPKTGSAVLIGVLPVIFLVIVLLVITSKRIKK